MTRRFAEKTDGIPAGSLNEGLLNIPMTAHILGSAPFGVNLSLAITALAVSP